MNTPAVEKNIIIYVMNLPDGVVESVRKYEELTKKKYRIMLLWDSRIRENTDVLIAKGVDLFVSCDFSKTVKIAEALRPYQDDFLAIVCRSEKYLPRFAAVIPHVPYLRTPTTESLFWSSDKYEMRKRMRVYDRSITPNFTLVKENSKKERERIIKKIGFPLIIKPTNLAASLFVSICYHEEELEKTLRTTFSRLRRAYKNDARLEEPKIIVEEYMDGDLYSIDSYVNSRGRVEHCPLVKQITAKKIGHDDFYNYLQITPPIFKRETVEKAQIVAEKAIHALGLRNTVTHTEMMKIDDEWKVVEIGARMGGFRHELHQLTCGIDHALNDILVRIPAKTILPKKCFGYACAMKWFASKEGKIIEMKGIKKIEQLESFHRIDVNKKIGDKAVFARNGGRSVFNLFLKNAERSKLLADIRRVEQLVEIKIGSRS
ncbi:MAG TPA: ATP-grasp domain-containing protein [Candidatus Paceibacterota bacterium]|nr:ATP-grasp domain-containing protein [Candidatus Paceibacterota bacterium]HMO82883.1 ATP-grasp domain-containing protein [Candidatus Paceibacterota bacterium]